MTGDATGTCHMIGIGTANPAFSIAQDDASRIAGEIGVSTRYRKSLPVLYRHSGVERRYSVLLLGDETCDQRQEFYPVAVGEDEKGPTTAERMETYRRAAPELAIQACRTAVDDANVDRSAVTHVVTISCSGFTAPGFEIDIIESLEFDRGVQRTHVGFMGCHGAMNGIRVARAICESQPDAIVLLCALEICSIHQQYTNCPQQLVANSLFADGCAAAIFVGSESNALTTRGSAEAWQCHVLDNASYLIEGTRDLMSWNIADHGFEMTLSPTVPEVIRRELKSWMESWLERFNLQISDVDDWIIHPGGPRIVEAVGESLNLMPEALQPSFHILNQHGNMSSPTVLYIWNNLLRYSEAATATNSKRIQVMVGFGPGLCVETVLIEAAMAAK